MLRLIKDLLSLASCGGFVVLAWSLALNATSI